MNESQAWPLVGIQYAVVGCTSVTLQRRFHEGHEAKIMKSTHLRELRVMHGYMAEMILNNDCKDIFI